MRDFKYNSSHQAPFLKVLQKSPFMHYVVLTELGIIVLDGQSTSRAFAFKDAVSEYMAVKERRADTSELVEYLSSKEAAASDKSLQILLEKKYVECRMMSPDELDTVRASRQQMLVDAGFASDQRDALEKLRSFALGLSSLKIGEVSQSPDLHIIQAVGALDETDKVANIMGARMREWYGLHFPELDNVIDTITGYAKVVLAGRRDLLTADIFEEAGLGAKSEMLLLLASKSRGGEITDINLCTVQSMARQVLEAHKLRAELEENIAAGIEKMAPNLVAILGPSVAAKMLGRAGSLVKLASFPASTIQVIGAERALFRAVKTGSDPPKHGLLFQHTLVHSAPRWQRGKIARAIAAKAAVAARVDVYGEGLNTTLLEKLNVRVGEISTRYENPPDREPVRRDAAKKRRQKKKRRFARR